jgi:iron complex outermembrane recepter protein
MTTGSNSTGTTASRKAVVISAGTVAATVATILAAHSGVARAADEGQGPQAAPAAVTLDEVIVTGYRKSLNAALDAKRDSVGSVDTIVAEDIAAFPELNLAESIQRNLRSWPGPGIHPRPHQRYGSSDYGQQL